MNNKMLILKSIAGAIFLILMMSLSLFLPFGSFKYNLAWLYLAVFFLSVFCITTYLYIFDKRLLKSRLSAGPDAEKRPFQKIIQLISGLVFISIFIVSAFDYRYKWSSVPLYLSYIGDILCGLAFTFLFFVFKQNPFLSATVEVQENQKVISTGLYALVRHPMYTGALLLILFTPIALGSYWGLIPVAVLSASIIIRAIDEEQELKRNLMGYDEYLSKVRYRIIPFVF